MKTKEKKDKLIYADTAQIVGIVDTTNENFKWNIFNYAYLKKALKVFEALQEEGFNFDDKEKVELCFHKPKHFGKNTDSTIFLIKSKGYPKAVGVAGIDRNAV